MNDDYSETLNINSLPFGYTLSIIGGKWKMLILYILSEFEVVRFNELQRKLTTITYKTLREQLKYLEEEGLVIRKEYAQIPPKVEYRLSEKGKTIIPILDSICTWGSENMPT